MKDPQVEVENTEDDDYLDIDASEDYGFVFTADGELKHMFTPDAFELNPPPIVRKILKLLGIKDLNSLPGGNENDTLH